MDIVLKNVHNFLSLTISVYLVGIYHIAQLYGGGKYWRIWRIDCHLPMFYLPIVSLAVIYSVGASFDNLVRKLLTLSCCYN